MFFLSGRAVVSALIAAVGTAAAAESFDARSTHGDWSVFTAGDPTECFASTLVMERRRPDGRILAEGPGPALLLVTVRPDGAVNGEVSYSTEGPLLDDGAAHRVVVGNLSLRVFSRDGWAWTSGPEDDRALLAAVRATVPIDLYLTGADGLSFVERFSGRGLSAALAQATELCAAGT